MSDQRSRRMVRFGMRLYLDEQLRLRDVARTPGCSLSEFAWLSMNSCAAETQEGADLFDRRRSVHPIMQDRRRTASGRRAYDVAPGRVRKRPSVRTDGDPGPTVDG